MSQAIIMPTRRLNAEIVEVLRGLREGDRVKVTQTVRVGAKTWPAETSGKFRGLAYLSTGVTTERVKDDDIIVPTFHFLKDNGELASIALDEHTKVVKIS